MGLVILIVGLILFLGALAGCNPTVGLGPAWVNDAIAIAAGTVLYVAIGYWFHPAVIGVPAFGR
jgi:hypothetical protein